jgi:hypothetical protein
MVLRKVATKGDGSVCFIVLKPLPYGRKFARCLDEYWGLWDESSPAKGFDVDAIGSNRDSADVPRNWPRDISLRT